MSAGVSLGATQAACLALLDAAEAASGRLDFDPEYARIRTTEFLLLLTRLGCRDGDSLGRLLEIGCGRGLTLRLWAEVADEVVGVDRPAALEPARALLGAMPAAPCRIGLVAGTGERLDGVGGRFDLIVTQYVLEHVDDIGAVLARVRPLAAPGARIVHVLNNVVDRSEWWIRYRRGTPALRRVWASLRSSGLRATLRDPFGFTPPHEARFGGYDRELDEYRLEKWALRVLRAGYEIVEYFQTRDTNWVLVTRAIEPPPGGAGGDRAAAVGRPGAAG